MEWNLDDLYLSFEDEAFKKDMEILDQLIVQVQKWSEMIGENGDNPVLVITTFIDLNEKVSTSLSKAMAFASLKSAANANDQQALDYLNRLSVKATTLTKPMVAFQGFLKQVTQLDELIEKNPTLKPYTFFLQETNRQAQYLLSEKEEVLISKMKLTGSTAWTNLQNMITSTLSVEVQLPTETKTMPLPAVRNLAYHQDEAVRKAGYDAEMKAYKFIEKSSAAAINGIKGEVNTLVELRGYKDALEETLIKSRMEPEILEAMLSAIKEYLPQFRKYYLHKATLLNHKNGLPFYDMFAPMGKTTTTYSYEQAMEFVITQFATFSESLASFTQHAYDHRWIDAFPREGKRGGAFCSNLHSIKQSRILTNFDGSFSNLTTLAHELGHAYHGHVLKDESILNSRYPMPLAETASIFCETIVVNAALKQASEQEQIAILEASISDAGQVIVDIYSRFLFEDALLKQRKDSVLSVEQLKEIMIDAQKQAYGEGLDSTQLHPYMWLNKPHYYSAGLNYYNFPYAFGLLFATGLYKEYLDKPQGFVQGYDKLLNATGKASIKDVAAAANIDITKPDFFKKSLSLIAEDINRFIELTS